MFCPHCATELTRKTDFSCYGSAVDCYDAECPECDREYAVSTDLQDGSVAIGELSPGETGIPDSVQVIRRITA